MGHWTIQTVKNWDFKNKMVTAAILKTVKSPISATIADYEIWNGDTEPLSWPIGC